MSRLDSFVRKTAIVCAIALIGLATACSKSTDAPASAASSQLGAGQNTVSKLGDLSEFQSIAQDVAGLVNQGDLALAKLRIKDLELAWDNAEAGLKPRAAADWHVLDDAIDQSLSALRASSPQAANCKATMDALMKTFNRLQGRA
ncbi:hypothetical protein [Pseudomonas nitroreducens]|uniref:hypothetical protein n=1 Tax=Pseudomonas nitroreducens TaxID=46680 RepID=UPI00380E1186